MCCCVIHSGDRPRRPTHSGPISSFIGICWRYIWSTFPLHRSRCLGYLWICVHRCLWFHVYLCVYVSCLGYVPPRFLVPHIVFTITFCHFQSPRCPGRSALVCVTICSLRLRSRFSTDFDLFTFVPHVLQFDRYVAVVILVAFTRSSLVVPIPLPTVIFVVRFASACSWSPSVILRYVCYDFVDRSISFVPFHILRCLRSTISFTLIPRSFLRPTFHHRYRLIYWFAFTVSLFLTGFCCVPAGYHVYVAIFTPFAISPLHLGYHTSRCWSHTVPRFTFTVFTTRSSWISYLPGYTHTFSGPFRCSYHTFTYHTHVLLTGFPPHVGYTQDTTRSCLFRSFVAHTGLIYRYHTTTTRWFLLGAGRCSCIYVTDAWIWLSSLVPHTTVHSRWFLHTFLAGHSFGAFRLRLRFPSPISAFLVCSRSAIHVSRSLRFPVLFRSFLILLPCVCSRSLRLRWSFTFTFRSIHLLTILIVIVDLGPYICCSLIRCWWCCIIINYYYY